MGKYDELFQNSIQDPEGFWAEAAEAIDWHKKWDRVLDDSKPPFYRWFSGGEMNTCYNAVDRHVENGRENQTAIIYDSPVTGRIQKITGHLPVLSGEAAASLIMSSAPVRPLRKVLEDAERNALVSALKETGGNRTKAASLLGVSMRGLFYKLQKYGIH